MENETIGCKTQEMPTVATAIENYLACPCQYFAPMLDDDPIMEAFNAARQQGENEGYLPVLIPVDDSLWECMIINSDPESDGKENYSFQPRNVAAYRREMCAEDLENAQAQLEELLQSKCADLEQQGIQWNEEVLGEVSEGEEIDRFLSYWNYDAERTMPMLLAKIPVEKVWQVFAYLPFGGWNGCPDTPVLMAAAKLWFEQYGAVPAVISHDSLEFVVPKPVDKAKALQLAQQQYALCTEIVDQGTEDGTIGTLADTLSQSTCWYFWWE